MGKFSGKTAFVTGGASGIGKATAIAFAKEGANVAVVTANSVAKAEALAAELKEQYGVEAIGIKCDVRCEADVEAAVKLTVDTFGSLDFAFNNAGVGPDGVTIPLGPITECTESDWDWIMDTNLKGVFLCMKHELRVMQKQNFGSIVNTSSTSSLKAMGNFGAYGPSKAGINYLTKCCAVENTAFGIRCNVVCPGPTLGTGMADRMFGKPGELKPGGPPRFGKPEDIAVVVTGLCSDECSHITGNIISADGGLDII